MFSGLQVGMHIRIVDDCVSAIASRCNPDVQDDDQESDQKGSSVSQSEESSVMSSACSTKKGKPAGFAAICFCPWQGVDHVQAQHQASKTASSSLAPQRSPSSRLAPCGLCRPWCPAQKAGLGFLKLIGASMVCHTVVHRQSNS